MSATGRILLIDDDAARRHDLGVILAFLGEEALVATSDQWQATLDGRESLLFKCVLLGECNLEAGFAGLLSQLERWDANLPLLLVEPEQPFLGTVKLRGLDYQHLDLDDFYPFGENVTYP